MSTSKLFQPVKVGDLNLEHRVVLAPLTRFRGTAEHVHTDLGVEYYRQRASTPGTLLITEGTFIAGKAGGYANVPAIETEEQIAAWKKVWCISFLVKLTNAEDVFHFPDWRCRS